MYSDDTPVNSYAYRGKNKHLDLLYDYLDTHEIPLKTILEVLGYSTERSLIDAGGFKRYRPGDKNKEQDEPLKRQFVKELYLAIHIDPSLFLINEKAEREFLKKPIGKKNGERSPDNVYFTRKFWSFSKRFKQDQQIRKVLDLSEFYEKVQKESEKISRDYLNITNPLITSGISELSVVEFLGKGTLEAPGQHLASYHKAHRDLFRKIEKILRNKERFKYRRVLCFEFTKKSTGTQIAEAILNLSFYSFVHIYYCLQIFDRWRVTVSVASVIRPVNVAIIKYTNKPTVLFSEYYKYRGENKGKILVPDVMFVNECNCNRGKDELYTLYSIYESEINRCTDQGNSESFITKENIEKYTLIAMKQAMEIAENDENHPVIELMKRKVKIMRIIRNKLSKQIKES